MSKAVIQKRQLTPEMRNTHSEFAVGTDIDVLIRRFTQKKVANITTWGHERILFVELIAKVKQPFLA